MGLCLTVGLITGRDLWGAIRISDVHITVDFRRASPRLVAVLRLAGGRGRGEEGLHWHGLSGTRGCFRFPGRCGVEPHSTDEQVALQTVSKRTTATTPDAATKPAAPPKDYSLKEGQTFSIKIPGREGKKAPSSSTAGSGGGMFSLPPPPPPGGRRG